MAVEISLDKTVTPDGIGRPDYSQPVPIGAYPKTGGYTLTDMGELAARLGSPAVYDRRGDVVFIDDFEGGIGSIEFSTSGLGAAYAWCGDRSFRGGFSVKVTAGSDADHYVQAKKYGPLPALGRVGYSAVLTMDSNMEQIEGYMDMYTGTYLIRWGYKYVAADAEISVLHSDGLWKSILSGSAYTSGYLFIPGKIVSELAAVSSYTRLLFGSSEIDLTSYAPLITLSAAAAHLEVYEKLTGVAGTNSVSYVDSMIVTQNEPANDQA